MQALELCEPKTGQEQDEIILMAKQYGALEDINLVANFGALMEGPPPHPAPPGAVPAGAEEEEDEWDFGGGECEHRGDDEGYGTDGDSDA